MRRGVVIAVAAMVAVLAAASGPAAGVPATGRSVAIFYYPWYGTPTRDGGWQHWNQHGAVPPQQVASSLLSDPGCLLVNGPSRRP